MFRPLTLYAGFYSLQNLILKILSTDVFGNARVVFHNSNMG